MAAHWLTFGKSVILLLAVTASRVWGADPVKVFILAGQSNMEGHGQVASLDHLGTHPSLGRLLSRLKSPDGSWAVRDDVFISWETYGQPRRNGPLTVGQGASDRAVGPELMFGTIMGERYDQPVLLIKTAWGGKDVYCDFRSPSAGPPDGDAARRLDRDREEGNVRDVGAYYRRMIAEVRSALSRIDTIVPGYNGQGYELAGFVWVQGWNDFCHWPQYGGLIEDYPRHLAAMIRDLRDDLGEPNLPVVIGELGVGGPELAEKAERGNGEARAILRFRQAQRRVAQDPALDRVTLVPTARYWDSRLEELRRRADAYRSEKREKGIADTPENHLPTKALNDEYLARGGHWYCHYNGSAATYSLIGYALAEALLDEPGIDATLAEPDQRLLAALSALTGHIRGDHPRTDSEIDRYARTIDEHHELIGSSGLINRSCLDLVKAYDQTMGPLWIAHTGFNRRNGPPPNDIHWAVYSVMQHVVDRVYNGENLAAYTALLDGFVFGSSAHFPGAVDPPADPTQPYTVKIDASYRKDFKHNIMHEERPARRPTGTYLAPGSIATLTVPESLVGKGYQVRVGAHSWDNARKPRVLRLDRSSIVYNIDRQSVRVASPLGGGIYIEVPMLCDEGVVEVTIRNAVRSPYFSAKPYHQTTLTEWRHVERSHPAPWADFQSRKFMMQVPSSWIRKLDDPAALMADWDAAMDVMNDLMGLPRVWGKETMYLQVDLQLRASVFAPGYPTVNDRFDPNREYDGYVDHYLIRGPRFAPDYVFHEQGHGYGFVKFAGETESTVNLLHVAVWNQVFGYSLDEAFRASRNFTRNDRRTLDNTAVAWMTSLNFASGTPMQPAEKAYQLKGHAKYVDIARLFGWQVLNDYWSSWTADREAGRPWSRHGTDIDKLSLRLSQSAGVDLTPLLHFWGTPPRDADALKEAVALSGLRPSQRVYDTLMRYRSLTPVNNRAFREFAAGWWDKQPSADGHWTEREHAAQWDTFDEKTSARIRAAVQEIIDEYFPEGRPEDG